VAEISGNPLFFATAEKFRVWLEANHQRRRELWVGFYKRSSGRPSISWPQSVDEALCFGWIDGIRKSLDAVSYANRFTPRNPGSTWSARNIARVKELIRQGRMRPAGLRAFQGRADEKAAIYSYEQRQTARLSPAEERRFRANVRAWAYFSSRPPWYRQVATYWVISAKREETRARRLATLIGDSARGRTIGPLTRPGSSQAK
jgi:uncharacterized protein YdeI (YjbR/CyaY-like superfamily)